MKKANMLAKYFHSANSNNLSCVFLSQRNLISRSVEQLITQCECKDNRLNLPLTANEFKACVSRTKNISPGGDQICYEMLKHLSDYSINVIIQFFNKIWFTGKISKNWLHSIVIPIYKPNRPIRSPTSYRLISLTSSLSKIMEKIINKQFIWYLETNNLLTPYQSGFRSRRRTTDHIMRLHDTVYKALANERSVLAVFLDIEKAYDMIFRDAVLFKPGRRTGPEPDP